MAIPELDFYYVPALRQGQLEIMLEGEEAHHALRTARHRAGDSVGLVNGQGLLAIGRIAEVQRNRCLVRILEYHTRPGEPKLHLSLGIGIIRPQRFEWLVEKATETGVTDIVPLLTQRSRPVEAASRVKRWQRIAIAAMKQCQRSVLPAIHNPLDYRAWLDSVRDLSLKVIAEASADRPLALAVRALPEVEPFRAAALVGPEGGFTPEEIDMALEAGFTPVRLGSFRLRSETAALLLSSLLLNIAEDLGGSPR